MSRIGNDKKLVKKINKHDMCCGCGVCSLVCKNDAIVETIDENGFKKYSIDAIKCVNCRSCSAVCPIECKHSHPKTDVFYVYRAKDDEVYLKSSSGGAFDAMARFILEEKKGVCFGVSYNEYMIPTYRYVESYEEINSFHGSKYICATGESKAFSDVMMLLRQGRYVLFSGSPCHISALNNYLGKKGVNKEKLYTMDFVCHGAGSVSFWKKHIALIERKAHRRILNYKFRHKLIPVDHSFHTKVEFEKNYASVDVPFTKIYDNLYFKNVLMQEACYSCGYASKERVSDISVGDNKGYIYSKKDVTNFTNASLLMANSDKGREILDYIKKYGYIMLIDINDLEQPHLSAPVEKPQYYNKFWVQYKIFGYIFVAIRYGSYNPISIWRMKRSGYLKIDK